MQAIAARTKPHLGFTSAHEKVFQAMIKKNLVTKVVGKEEPETLRLAIFIDDLDRCLPEVAIQILEAIKLFFDMQGVVFILGVDRDVVDRMMVRHYTAALGPESAVEKQRVARKARQYLDKMFQVEIQVPPNDEQVAQFAQEEVQELSGWEMLSEDQRIRINVALKYVAGINPRGVIRALNSAFMGATELLDNWPSDEAEIALRQTALARTVQERLLDTVLSGTDVASLEDDFHDAARHADGRAFFRDWSAVVQEQRFYLNKSDLAPSSEQARSADRADEIASPSVETSDPTLGERIGRIGRLREKQESEGPSGKELLIEIARRHPSHADLLTVAPLAAVLHIVPYGGENPEATRTTTTSDQSVDDFELFCQAVARDQRILLEDLDREELRKSGGLNLVGSDITPDELRGIRHLKALKDLDLRYTTVTDLTPLQGLTSLEVLDLRHTQVTDLTPLQGLTSLECLFLQNTPVRNLTPLRQKMHHTQVLLPNGTIWYPRKGPPPPPYEW